MRKKNTPLTLLTKEEIKFKFNCRCFLNKSVILTSTSAAEYSNLNRICPLFSRLFDSLDMWEHACVSVRGLAAHMWGDPLGSRHPSLGRDPRKILDALLGINKTAEWETIRWVIDTVDCWEWWIADYPCNSTGDCGAASLERLCKLQCAVEWRWSLQGPRVHYKWPQPIAQASTGDIVIILPQHLSRWARTWRCLKGRKSLVLPLLCCSHIQEMVPERNTEIRNWRRLNRLISPVLSSMWGQLNGLNDTSNLGASSQHHSTQHGHSFYLLCSVTICSIIHCRVRYLSSVALLATVVLHRCGV